MVGILAGESRMGKRLTRFGYCQAQARSDTLLAAQGEILRGHEFHYSDFTSPLPPVFDSSKWRDGVAIQRQWLSTSAHSGQLSAYPFCPAPRFTEWLADGCPERAMTLSAWFVAFLLDSWLATCCTGRTRCAGWVT